MGRLIFWVVLLRFWVVQMSHSGTLGLALHDTLEANGWVLANTLRHCPTPTRYLARLVSEALGSRNFEVFN